MGDEFIYGKSLEISDYKFIGGLYENFDERTPILEIEKLNKFNKNPYSPNILLLGGARSGKDTMAEILNQEFGLSYTSSSQAAADIFIYDELKDKYGYKSPEECFEDRVNHRAEWYNMICDYNKNDRARLAKDILNKSDAYIGMRDREEIEECVRQGLFDLIIWVDASKRVSPEDKSSFNIDMSCADIIIENNSDFDTFKKKVINFGKFLYN